MLRFTRGSNCRKMQRCVLSHNNIIAVLQNIHTTEDCPMYLHIETHLQLTLTCRIFADRQLGVRRPGQPGLRAADRLIIDRTYLNQEIVNKLALCIWTQHSHSPLPIQGS